MYTIKPHMYGMIAPYNSLLFISLLAAQFTYETLRQDLYWILHTHCTKVRLTDICFISLHSWQNCCLCMSYVIMMLIEHNIFNTFHVHIIWSSYFHYAIDHEDGMCCTNFIIHIQYICSCICSCYFAIKGQTVYHSKRSDYWQATFAIQKVRLFAT